MKVTPSNVIVKVNTSWRVLVPSIRILNVTGEGLKIRKTS